MMTDRDRFYEERDQRSRQLGLADTAFNTPVGISVGEGASESPAGQLLCLATVNMMSRIHRNLQLRVPNTKLLIPSLTGGTTLREAAESLAIAIDPFESERQ